jgi:hypothetical protein
MRRRARKIPLLRTLAFSAAMTLCGCASNPLADISLPQLCPRTSAGGEVMEMAALIRGHSRREVVAHFGAPGRTDHDAETITDKLVWGPLAVLYRRDNGQTVPMACEVEMHAGADGAISRVIWALKPPESQYPEAGRESAPVPVRVETIPAVR